MTNIVITEVISDTRRTLDDGQVIGHVKYTYQSPTHWSSGGICTVMEEHNFDGSVSASLSWGSGGINVGFNEIQIADAMSRGFAMASNRLSQLANKQEELV